LKIENVLYAINIQSVNYITGKAMDG